MALLICRPFTNGCSTYMGSKTSTLQRSPATDSQKVLVVTCESPHCMYLSYTQGEVTSQSLWSRYDRHFLGTTRYNAHTHTHTHTFNGPFSRTTRVGRYQKCKTNLDFTKTRDSEWQRHQLGHMQVCTLLQTGNHTSSLIFYRPDALPAVQQTASKH